MRRRAARVLSGVFAFGWIVVPGFGAIDLTVTWDPDWPQVLEAGWGLYFTVVVGVPFLVAAARPRAAAPGVAQLAVASIALAISGVVARERVVLVLAAAVALGAAAVRDLTRDVPRPRLRGLSMPLLALAAIGAVPWLAYALDMWALNRQELVETDITNSIDHYSVQGALGLVLAVLPVIGAARADLRPFVPVCAGVAAGYLGLVSFAWEDAAGGFGPAWSAVAMGWGAALAAVALVDRARTSRAESSAHSIRVRVTRNP
jgi:hypothetical protein